MMENASYEEPQLVSGTELRREVHVLTHASFFSGIGGFDLGFERAGIQSVFQCEKNAFCRQILAQHWGDIPCEEDINALSADRIPHADIWTGGFPCQDVSLARMGARSGLRGKQSGLFFRFAELLGERLPKAVVIENVHGLLTSHRGRDFGIVLKTLDEFGYGLAWRVLNSKDFGVPQSRRRVFIVGVHRDAECAAKVLFEPERCEGHPEESGSSGEEPASLFQTILGDPRKGPLTKALAHCIYAESARHTGTDWSRNYVWYPDGRVRRLTSLEVERVQGFPDDWTLPKDFDGDISKLESVRYHAVGNSVTPTVAEWIGVQLNLALQDEVLLRKHKQVA